MNFYQLLVDTNRNSFGYRQGYVLDPLYLPSTPADRTANMVGVLHRLKEELGLDPDGFSDQLWSYFTEDEFRAGFIMESARHDSFFGHHKPGTVSNLENILLAQLHDQPVDRTSKTHYYNMYVRGINMVRAAHGTKPSEQLLPEHQEEGFEDVMVSEHQKMQQLLKSGNRHLAQAVKCGLNLQAYEPEGSPHAIKSRSEVYAQAVAHTLSRMGYILNPNHMNNISVVTGVRHRFFASQKVQDPMHDSDYYKAAIRKVLSERPVNIDYKIGLKLARESIDAADYY